jgi:hypothetical protein
MFLSVRREALRRTIDSYTESSRELDVRSARKLAGFTMAMADGIFIAHEIDTDSGSLVDDADLLTVALLAAAKHPSPTSPPRRKRHSAEGRT